MLKFLRKSGTWALSIITVIFTFVPEAIFEKCKLLPFFSNDMNIVLIRVLAFLIVLLLTIGISILYLYRREKICIKGNNYSIQIEYGDLLEMRNCKKVITFDECFTTKVVDSP